MNHSGTLGIFLLFLFITACNTQEQTAPVKKRIEIKASPIEAPAKVNTVPQQSMPALNLSLDNISFEQQKNNDDIFINDNVRTEENSALFNTLNKKQTEPSINLSGEILTDKNVDEKTDFLESIDGIQVEVKGRFN